MKQLNMVQWVNLDQNEIHVSTSTFCIGRKIWLILLPLVGFTVGREEGRQAGIQNVGGF